jgi:hypothetical protein
MQRKIALRYPALAVAANIVWTGIGIVRRSVAGLMDVALSSEDQVIVRKSLEDYELEGVRFHALQTCRSGARKFMSVHILVPGQWTNGVTKSCNVLTATFPRPYQEVRLLPIWNRSMNKTVGENSRKRRKNPALKLARKDLGSLPSTLRCSDSPEVQ